MNPLTLAHLHDKGTVPISEALRRRPQASKMETVPFVTWDASVADAETCRRCGRPLMMIARYCGHCGLSLRAVDGTARLQLRRAIRRGILLRQRGPAWSRLAIRSFRIAMNGMPGAPEPMLEIARTYARAGLVRPARRWYRYLLRRVPDELQAWLEGVETYPRQDHFARARWLCRALQHRPDEQVIRTRLEGHFARLTGWQRWWIEQAIWPICQSERLEMAGRS